MKQFQTIRETKDLARKRRLINQFKDSIFELLSQKLEEMKLKTNIPYSEKMSTHRHTMNDMLGAIGEGGVDFQN